MVPLLCFATAYAQHVVPVRRGAERLTQLLSLLHWPDQVRRYEAELKSLLLAWATSHEAEGRAAAAATLAAIQAAQYQPPPEHDSTLRVGGAAQRGTVGRLEGLRVCLEGMSGTWGKCHLATTPLPCTSCRTCSHLLQYPPT